MYFIYILLVFFTLVLVGFHSFFFLRTRDVSEGVNGAN